MVLREPASRVHFFIPCYFDTESFLLLREKVLGMLPSPYQARFHLLDDSAGSDLSLSRLSELADVEVVTMPYSLGHQRAIVLGMRRLLPGCADSDLVVTMDSDGEDRPEDLQKLFSAYQCEEDLRPIVLAQRSHRKEQLPFRVLYFFYKRVFHALTGTVIQTGNYALLPASVAKSIIFHPYFDLAYSSTLFLVGTRLRFVPCPRGTRYCGQSKMNFSKLAIHGLRMLMPFMDRIAVRGVIAFSLFTLVSIVSSVALAFVHFTHLHAVPAWMLAGALVVFVVSFLSICSFVILFTIYASVQALAFSGTKAGS